MAEHTAEDRLTGILRWVESGRHSGILELPTAGRSSAELVFVEGALHLPQAYPPSQRLAKVLEDRDSIEENPAPLREALRELAEDVTGREVGTFRFRRRPSRDGDVGPVDPTLLTMELAVLERSERQLLDWLGGEKACWVASGESAAVLTADEKHMLERLEEPQVLRRLCPGPERRQEFEALCRLAAAGLAVRSSAEEEKRKKAALGLSLGEASASDLMPENLFPELDALPVGSLSIGSLPTVGTETPGSQEASHAVPSTDQGVEQEAKPEVFTHPTPHPASLAIWRDQFRLTGDPFSLTPDPAFLYLSESHAEALAGLKLGIWERRGLLVMIGEVGTGKTTLVYSLLSQLDSQIETAYLSNTLLSFEEIMVTALRDLGVPCESHRRLDLIEALNSFLRRAATEGRTVVLVIDEAQNLSHEAFEGLRLLLNFETYKTKLLQIILVGQPELAVRLGQPGLRQVRDRVAVRCRLGSLDRRETKGYIEHRLATVGGSSEIFTRPALGLLVRKSRGVPRRINILCHNSMLFAYGKDLVRVHRAIVAQAIRDVDGPLLS